ncbi:MAG: cytidine deaminase, partial [Chloroflexota bacterium]
MKLDQKLIDAATDQLATRFPGEGGLAAAAYTADGSLFTSVVFDPEWGGGGLCAETGALLDIHKTNKRLTAIACVSRLDGDGPLYIATPCGICQERIYHWGYDVEIAVPTPEDPTQWMMRTLGDIQPYHWVRVYVKDI